MPAPRPAGGGLASEIADPGLAAAGAARIGERFAVSQPLRGLTIAACLHVTAETAVLVGVLRDGGARVMLAASNPAVRPGRGGRRPGRGRPRHLLPAHRRRAGAWA